MGTVLNEKFFTDFAEKVKKKLTVLWPSKKSTAPTESNLVTIFAGLLESRNYNVFTEVPVTFEGKDGRIDLLAINEEKTEMVLFEAKSGKSGESQLLQEMTSDWNRIKGFSLSDLYDNDAEINKIDAIKKHICVGFWSEDKDKKILNKSFSPDVESAEAFSHWINIAPSGIGIKFYCKTL